MEQEKMLMRNNYHKGIDNELMQEFTRDYTRDLSQEARSVIEQDLVRPTLRSRFCAENESLPRNEEDGNQMDMDNHDNESILHELPTENEEAIQKNLMPGMEQKKLMEPRQQKTVIVKVKRGDYHLSWAIFLIVLLIGFFYYTQD